MSPLCRSGRSGRHVPEQTRDVVNGGSAGTGAETVTGVYLECNAGMQPLIKAARRLARGEILSAN